MLYYFPSAAGQAVQTQTSLPICSDAVNCPYFEEGLCISTLPNMVRHSSCLLSDWLAGRAAFEIGCSLKKTDTFIGTVTQSHEKLHLNCSFLNPSAWCRVTGPALHD